jgi:hypothetical protein
VGIEGDRAGAEARLLRQPDAVGEEHLMALMDSVKASKRAYELLILWDTCALSELSCLVH